jgi:hypothetical protein
MSALLTPVVDHRYEVVRLGERFACFWIVRDLSATPFGASWSEIDLTLAARLLIAAARGHQLHPILTEELKVETYGLTTLALSDTRNRRQFTLGAAAEKYLSGALIPWRETGQRLAVNAHNLPVQFAENPLNWGTWSSIATSASSQGGLTSDKPNHDDPLSEYHRRRAQSRPTPVARNSATWRTFPRADGKLQSNLSDLVMRPVRVNGRIQIPLNQYLNETEISVLVTADPQDAVEILTEGGLP